MYQVYFTADIDEQLSEKLALHAQSISILYDEKAIIALFDDEDEIPSFAKDYILQINNLEEEVWKYRYLDYLTGVAITPSIYVYPTTKALGGDSSYKYTIALNPKDAFGDGTHPTTRMCIQQLETIVNTFSPEERQMLTLCDIGTGTGIIAIVAAMLGIGTIEAFDIDTTSVERAKENAAQNGCNRISFFVSDVADMKAYKKYKIIVANLLSDIIEKNVTNIVSLVEKGGTIILSGVGHRWVKGIIQLFQQCGCTPIHDESMSNWHCIVLKAK